MYSRPLFMGKTIFRRIRLFALALPLTSFILVFAVNNGNRVPSVSQSTNPTPDRLAKPTLSSLSSQSDYGAQVYWLSCLPCHGDRGQGLTDEFRQVYPPEDRNCWRSGCHGKRPYDNGFQLPTRIPAVVGTEALQKFSNAATLEAYIKNAMPYWKPGSLSESDTWAVTAYVLKMNGIAPGQELNAGTAAKIRLRPEDAVPTLEPASARSANAWLWLLILGGGLLAGFLAVSLLSRPKSRRS